MSSHEADTACVPRRVRISRPAFQDMHYLVVPRLVARAQLRRHAMKLRFWRRVDACVADLDCFPLQGTELFVLKVTDGFGLAEGFQIVFCEESTPERGGTLCVLSVMRIDEPFSAITLEILRGREVVARERLKDWFAAGDF